MGVMFSDTLRAEVAAALADAERSRVAIAPLRQTWPEIDVVDAYEIQLINIRRRLARGVSVNGHKVGLSSKAMQEMMGVDEPDYGHLLSDMQVRSGVPVRVSDYCTPRVEVEVGFILGAALPTEGCTEDDVIDATEHVAPAIELIDSRIVDWDITIADTIADNASSAGYVLGDERVRPTDLDLRAIERACCATVTRCRRAIRRSAGQPRHRGRLAGQQGRLVRGHARGGSRHSAGKRAPRDRRPPRRRLRGGLRRPRQRSTDLHRLRRDP